MGPLEPPPRPVRPRRGRRSRQPCQRRPRRPTVDGDVQAGDPRVPGQLDATPRQRRSRQADHPVRLVCASAAGYYGERGDEPLTEESGPGSTFFTDVVAAWEAAAAPAVACRRVGRATAAPASSWPEDGPMSRLLTLARLGLAGPMAGDACTCPGSHSPTRWARSCTSSTARRSRVRSTSSAPSPSANATSLRRWRRRCTGRPSSRPPRFGVHMVVGEFAGEILSSKRIVGDVLRDSGYSFVHPDLDSAIRWLVA